MKKVARIFYIDNLRIFLIALVVLHHLSITYGASGDWYYKEVEGDTFTTLILTGFTATNQSFFMGLFFLISAYFTRISLEKKPIGLFVKDRLIRLGIPLIIFYFLLSPLTIYLRLWLVEGVDYSFIEYVRGQHGFGFGPMWFVETLIYFSFIYVAYRLVFRNKKVASKNPPAFPKPLVIILAALIVSAVSFIIRLWFPLGSSLGDTGLQLPYFPQYIAMLVFGILFAKYNWFEKITYRQGVLWFLIAQFFIFIVFPVTFYFGTKESGLEPFSGGWNWQALTLAVWEQLTGFSIMIGLIGIFKQRFSDQGIWAKRLSGAAYAVYIIHPVLIVALSASLKDWAVYPVLKFIFIAPIALFLCFGMGILIKKIPLVNKVV